MFEGVGKRLRGYAEKDGRGYPDWAVRYMPVVHRLERRPLARERVLEIGANENGFARFARVKTIAADRKPGHVRAARETQPIAPVVASIDALPIATGTVDVCVCVDTFEHLPEALRGPAIEEILRVLKPTGEAVVAFPSGDAAAEAERRVREAYAAHTGQTLHWFEEHLEMGLPDASDVAGMFEQAAGGRRAIERGKNGSLAVWRAMWHILLCGWPGRGNAVFQALLRLCTPVLTRIHLGACYRAVIWMKPE